VNSAVEDANERQAVPPPLHKNVTSYEKCCCPLPGASVPDPSDPYVFGPPGSGSGDFSIIKQK
jgi:hypothetical protein